MAFENCISEIVAAGNGKVDAEEARNILAKVFDRATRHERNGTSRADAALRAAREIGGEERIAAAIEKRNALINEAIRTKLRDERTIAGKEADSARALLTGVEGNRRGFAQSIDAAAHDNTAKLHGGVLAELRKTGLLKALLRRDKNFERDVAREMWRLEDPQAGTGTGNRFAKQAAEILHRYQELARDMQNRAGAWIGKLDHYVTRQSHDQVKIRGRGGEEGYAEWRDFIEPKLDESTFDGVENRETFLRNVWTALSSGVHDLAGGADWLAGFQGPGNLGKKLSQERKLHFKDADSWFDYNARFGRGNVLDSVMRGLEHAGRNTAIMDALGTNPEAMFKGWIDKMTADALARNDHKTVAALRNSWNDRILDVVTGKASQPDSLTLAQIGRHIRAVESMAKLGGVVLSSIPDIAVNASTLRWNGIPLLQAYGQAFLSPLLGRRTGATRETADLFGVGISGMLGRIMSRFAAEDGFTGKVAKMVEITHRLNLLGWWTDSLSTGMGLILSSNLAKSARLGFAELPERLQITLRRYGIEAPEWDAIRQAETRAADGNNYLMPGSMANLPDGAIAHLDGDGARIREDLRSKLGSYIIDQTREGMTEPRAGDRAAATWGTQAGTRAGEAMRLLMQFKQYPITLYNRSIKRELQRDGVDVAGLASLIVGTTALGYVAMTAKDLAKGRNPREPEKGQDYTKLVMAAMTQGGGLGIYGDFLFGEANRVGGGVVSSLAGPAAGTAESAIKIFDALRDGSDTKSRGQRVAAEAVQFGKNNAPFVNLFYTRAALDYFIMYRLQEAVNPGYLRRYEQKVKKDNAQTFWLRPTSAVH